jgi:xylan 1,4-beta-xylosidase
VTAGTDLPRCAAMTTLWRRGALAIAVLALAVAAPGGARAATLTNPVLPGDDPDPTIVRAGGAFYASATSASWAPIFPVFRSVDLVRWRQVGAVLPTAPRWAAGNFWAPELVRWSGRMLAFYSASRRGGSPCLGVASAARPEGPWRDRGAILCRPGGTIDVDPFTDADGTRWLLFKRLGAGHGIYGMRFSERRLRAVGHAHELIAPDAGWEQGVTEGPTLVRRGGAYLLFYAGGHCCRPPCTYAEGVARSSSLLGPYAKDPANPLLTGNTAWRCPGHGTTVDLGSAGLFLLHHAYRADDALDRRRSALLDRIDIGADGWPTIAGGQGPAVTAPAPLGAAGMTVPAGFSDGFASRSLAQGWEWPFFAAPDARPKHGALRLKCRASSGTPTFLARQVPVDRFTAVATVVAPGAHGPGIGLAAHGPGRVLRGIELRDGRLRGFRADDRGLKLGPAGPAPGGRRLRLLVNATPDGAIALYAGAARGAFARVPGGPAQTGPPPTRVALTCRGTGSVSVDSVRVADTAQAP